MTATERQNELLDYVQAGRNDFLEGKSFSPPIDPEHHPDYGVDLKLTEIDEMRENREAYIKGFNGELDKKSEQFRTGRADKLKNQFNPPMKPEDHPDFRSGMTTSEKEEMHIEYQEYISGYNSVKNLK